jgi:hypothetical protein
VGPGGSQEAAFDLRADVPAGIYRVVCDAIIIRAIPVTFDLIWRRGDTDRMLATWTQQFEPLPDGQYLAQPYEIDHEAPAIDFAPGDQLVFRYTGGPSTSMQAFIPNGDGARANGRIPNITLPR